MRGNVMEATLVSVDPGEPFLPEPEEEWPAWEKPHFGSIIGTLLGGVLVVVLLLGGLFAVAIVVGFMFGLSHFGSNK